MLKIFQELKLFKGDSSWAPLLPPWFWKIVTEAAQLKCNLVFLIEIWSCLFTLLVLFPEIASWHSLNSKYLNFLWVQVLWKPGWLRDSPDFCWSGLWEKDQHVWVATCRNINLCVWWTFENQMSGLTIGIREENMQPPNPSDWFPVSFAPGSFLHLRPRWVNKIIGVFPIIDPNLSALAFQIHSHIASKLWFHLDIRCKYVFGSLKLLARLSKADCSRWVVRNHWWYFKPNLTASALYDLSVNPKRVSWWIDYVLACLTLLKDSDSDTYQTGLSFSCFVFSFLYCWFVYVKL